MSYYDDCWDYDDSEYAGTYVHDVEGWDDDLINTVLDGNPDAYWNIDQLLAHESRGSEGISYRNLEFLPHRSAFRAVFNCIAKS